MPGPRSSGVRASGALSRLLLLVLVAVMAGVLVAGLVVPIAGAAGLATRSASESFADIPDEIDVTPLPLRSTIRDRNGGILAQFYFENRTLVPLSAVSPVMKQALVAIEDSRFFEHGGVDLRGTLRAFVNNRLNESTQGGSTITQQYVKLVLLEQAVAIGDVEGQKNAVQRTGKGAYARKLKELRYAIALEDRLSKEQILENYLNIAYFGSGAYGVEAAARHYFGKSAAELGLAEAATLAGIVQSPGRYDPTLNPLAAKQRRDVVLARMSVLRDITRADADAAIASPLTLNVLPVANGCSSTGAAYFCDYVVHTIENDPAYGATPADRRSLLQRGGLTITSTIDPVMHAAAQQAVDDNIPRADPSGFGTAISMVQPGTGHIMAMAQNRTWGTAEGDSSITTLNYNVDRTVGGSLYGWQGGSTFKTFTVAAAIQLGIPVGLEISVPGRQSFTNFRGCKDGYRFPAYEAAGRPGSYSMRTGLWRSVNTWAVALEERTGLCAPIDVATALGLRRGDGQPLNRVPSFTLGTDEVTPLSMAIAYATLAARGVHCPATGIIEVRDRAGTVIPGTPAPCTQAIDPAIADAVNDILADNIDGPDGGRTGKNMTLGRPAGGKTGTTNDARDVWFVGHTPNLATAVWVGDPGRVVNGTTVRAPLQNVTINGRRIAAAFGSTVAGPIWKQAMAAAVQLLPPVDFVKPDPKVIRGTGVDVPDVRGMSVARATAVLEAVGLEVRVSGTRTPSQSVPEGRVATTRPGPGATSFSGETVTLVLSSGRPSAPAPDPTPTPVPPAPVPPGPPPPANGGGNGGNGNGGNGNGNGNGGNGNGNG